MLCGFFSSFSAICRYNLLGLRDPMCVLCAPVISLLVLLCGTPPQLCSFTLRSTGACAALPCLLWGKVFVQLSARRPLALPIFLPPSVDEPVWCVGLCACLAAWITSHSNRGPTEELMPEGPGDHQNCILLQAQVIVSNLYYKTSG